MDVSPAQLTGNTQSNNTVMSGAISTFTQGKAYGGTKRKRSSGSSVGKKPKLTPATVAKIARRVVNSNIELKQLTGTQSQTFAAADGYYHFNLNYIFSQGITFGTQIGEKVKLKHLRIRVLFQNGSGAPDKVSYARVSVTKSRTNWTSTKIQMTAITDIYKSGTILPLMFPDNSKVKFLYDNYFQLPAANITNQQAKYVVPIDIPFNKVETFQYDNAGIFRDGDYFLEVGLGDYTSSTATFACNISWEWDFQDA